MMTKIEFGTMACRDSDKQLVYLVGMARNVDKAGENGVVIFAPVGENGFVIETCVQDKKEFMRIFSKI